MVTSASAIESLLNTQVKASYGNDVVSGLLDKKTSKLDTLGILQTSFGGNVDATSDNAGLRDFIDTYVPNNEKILQDLKAVEALSNLADDGGLSSTAAFVNPYRAALALDDGSSQNVNSLFSLLA